LEITSAPPASQLKQETPAQFSETVARRLVNAAVAQLRKEFEPIRREVDGFKEETERERWQQFCERLLRENRIEPKDIDPGAGPNHLVEIIMRQDNRHRVHRFAEGGKQLALTERDIFVRYLQGRPVLRVPGQVRGRPLADDPAADRKAWAAATYQSFAEQPGALALGGNKEEWMATIEKQTDEQFQQTVADYATALATAR
jgi:hypothetical protein